MEYYDEVVLLTDSRFAETALAFRGLLEAFTLKVRFIRLAQRRQFDDFFAGRVVPLKGVTVLASHGFTSDAGMGLRFEAVDNPEGDARAVTGWAPVTYDLTPANIPELVTGLGGTVLSLACGGGREEIANAFLAAGVDRYIGPAESYVDMDAALMFAAGWFYFMLSGDRDLTPRSYSPEEAVERARAIDAGWTFGPDCFRCYSRANDAVSPRSTTSPQ